MKKKQEKGRNLEMDVTKTQEISSRAIEKVMVHPLVLLSVVDHYNRVDKDSRQRVIGVLPLSISKTICNFCFLNFWG